MGKIDTYTKRYLSMPERYAELINVSIFQGKQVVEPQKLRLLQGRYPSFTALPGERERDIFAEYDDLIRFGIEIEAGTDYGEPRRIMTYDAADYEAQLSQIDYAHRQNKDYRDFWEKKSRMQAEDRLIPVVTGVLYLGEGAWQGQRSLLGMLCEKGTAWYRAHADSPDFLCDGGLNDYRIRVIEAEHVNAADYRTDLREFFEILQCRRDQKRLRALVQSERYRSLSRDAQLAIAVNLGSKAIWKKVEKEEKDMCQAIMEMLEEERILGRSEGIGEGIIEGERLLATLLQRLVKDGRKDEAALVLADEAARKRLYGEYGLTGAKG